MNANSLKSDPSSAFDMSRVVSEQPQHTSKKTSSTLAKTRIQPASAPDVRVKLTREEALRQAILRTG